MKSPLRAADCVTGGSVENEPMTDTGHEASGRRCSSARRSGSTRRFRWRRAPARPASPASAPAGGRAGAAGHYTGFRVQRRRPGKPSVAAPEADPPRTSRRDVIDLRGASRPGLRSCRMADNGDRGGVPPRSSASCCSDAMATRRRTRSATAISSSSARAQPNEGKTFCAINLALSIASERDLTVMLSMPISPSPRFCRRWGSKAGRA